jgi:hypothetical protein
MGWQDRPGGGKQSALAKFGNLVVGCPTALILDRATAAAALMFLGALSGVLAY